MSGIESTRPLAQQARSRRTEQRILRAALDLIADLGEQSITMSAVSDRADVSVGSIYRRFGSREELLIAVAASFAQDFLDRIEASLDSPTALQLATPESVIRFATLSFVHAFEGHERPFARLYLLGLSDPNIYQEGSLASVAGGKRYLEFIMRARDAIRRPDPEAAVDMTYRTLYAFCSHYITQGPYLESHRRVTWESVAEELAQMNVAYLLSPPTAAE